MADNDKLEHQCLVSGDDGYRNLIILPRHRVVFLLLFFSPHLFLPFVFLCFLAKRIRVGTERRGTLDTAPTEHHTQREYLPTYFLFAPSLAPVCTYCQFVSFKECVRRFPSWDNDVQVKQEKFVLSTSPDQLKSIVSISGDTILQAVNALCNT